MLLRLLLYSVIFVDTINTAVRGRAEVTTGRHGWNESLTSQSS